MKITRYGSAINIYQNEINLIDVLPKITTCAICDTYNMEKNDSWEIA
jgi:hypothetical protein